MGVGFAQYFCEINLCYLMLAHEMKANRFQVAGQALVDLHIGDQSSAREVVRQWSVLSRSDADHPGSFRVTKLIITPHITSNHAFFLLFITK